MAVVAYDDWRMPAIWGVAGFNPGTCERGQREHAPFKSWIAASKASSFAEAHRQSASP